ncbi:MAG: glycosyltransferase [Flavobacteriaceae bacterium]
MNKRILVSPLNWGLGHATRCIPIINALIESDFEPIISSDGAALLLLKKEFPQLTSLELPSYNITYSEKKTFFKFILLRQLPKLLKSIKKENDFVNKIISEYNIDGIISDNRFGVYSSKVPSVYLTHQLNVLSGKTTWLTTKMHQFVMDKFDECWIPEKLLKEQADYKGNILFVKGVFEDRQTKIEQKPFTIFNFMETVELEKAINQSKLVIARSGYTTIMDLANLNKKAFFIPTPGQFEQEYLATYLKELKLVPYCTQEDFSIKKLEEVNKYNGLKYAENRTDFKDLFSLF